MVAQSFSRALAKLTGPGWIRRSSQKRSVVRVKEKSKPIAVEVAAFQLPVMAGPPIYALKSTRCALSSLRRCRRLRWRSSSPRPPRSRSTTRCTSTTLGASTPHPHPPGRKRTMLLRREVLRVRRSTGIVGIALTISEHVVLFCSLAVQRPETAGVPTRYIRNRTLIIFSHWRLFLRLPSVATNAPTRMPHKFKIGETVVYRSTRRARADGSIFNNHRLPTQPWASLNAVADRRPPLLLE